MVLKNVKNESIKIVKFRGYRIFAGPEFPVPGPEFFGISKTRRLFRIEFLICCAVLDSVQEYVFS